MAPVLKLNAFVYVTGFTIEHIPRAVSPYGRIDSAPKTFTVWVSNAESGNNMSNVLHPIRKTRRDWSTRTTTNRCSLARTNSRRTAVICSISVWTPRTDSACTTSLSCASSRITATPTTRVCIVSECTARPPATEAAATAAAERDGAVRCSVLGVAMGWWDGLYKFRVNIECNICVGRGIRGRRNLGRNVLTANQ